MSRFVVALILGGTALVTAPLASNTDIHAVGSFRRVANFNVPGGTSAEIVSATPDGRFIVYSDAIGHQFGLVDISNPVQPQQIGSFTVDGDPTSVAVLPDGTHALGIVQPGRLLLIDLASFTVKAERAIGEGPDSVAVARIGAETVAVIAIENEGAGKGFVEIVRVNTADFANSPGTTVQFSDAGALASAGLVAVDDPQPEYVSIHGTKAAVTLQENNGIAVIDISNPSAPVLDALFSTGMVGNRPADLSDDSSISFTDVYPADVLSEPGSVGARIPDAIGWSSDGSTLFTADEGEEDFEGGRGWSAHHSGGGFFYDDGGELEQQAVRFGHYPDGRSDAKGIEAEGLATAVFGSEEFLFVTSERGSFVAVYRLDGQNRAHFVQMLGTGQAPECALPIPARNLLVTANEGDEGDGSISIFEGIPGRGAQPDTRPQIASRSAFEPWGALSGLAADLQNSRALFAVPDDALPSSIFRITLNGAGARIERHAAVTRDGEQALFDLEGIAVDTSIRRPSANAGFWLAAEGNASADAAERTNNTLIQVDADGVVLDEIFLPPDIDSVGGKITSNGFEGVAVSGNGRYLLVAVQRPFVGDDAIDGVTHTRIARYDLLTNKWEAFFYPLQNSPGTIGLSEITLLGATESGADVFAVIERDNRLAASANLKRVYTVTVAGLTPVDIGVAANPANAAVVASARVSKTLFENVLPAFAPYEKVEGLTITSRGEVWVVLDNDGGEFESRFVRIR